MLSPASTAPSPSSQINAVELDLVPQSKSSGVRDQLHSALKELVRLRLAEKELRTRLEAFAVAETTPVAAEAASTQLDLLKHDKAQLVREIQDLKYSSEAVKDRMQQTALQIQRDLDAALSANQQLRKTCAELEDKLAKQRSLLSVICHHVKLELNAIVQAGQLTDDFKERVLALMAKVEEGADPTCIPDSLLERVCDVTQMSQELLKLTQGLEDYERRVQELNRFLLTKRTQETKLEQEVKDLRNQLNEEVDRNKTSEKAKLEVELRLHSVEAELATLRRSKETDSRSLKLFEHELREARLEKDVLKAALETAICKANQQLLEQIEALQSKQLALAAELETERSVKSTANEDVSKLRTQITELESAVKQERERHAQEVADLNKRHEQALNEVDRARHDLELLVKFETQVATLKDKVDTLVRENERLAQELEKRQSEPGDTESRQALQAEIDRLHQQVNESFATIKALESSVSQNAADAADVEALVSSRDKAVEELTRIQENLEEAQNAKKKAVERLELMMVTVSDLKATRGMLEERVLMLQKAAAKADGGKSSDELKTVTAKLAEATALQDSLQERLRVALGVEEADAEALIQSCTQLRTRFEHLESEVAVLSSAKTALETANAALTAQLADASKQRSGPTDEELLQRLSTMQIAKESLEQQVESYASHCKGLETSLSEQQDELERLEQSHQSRIAELEKAHAEALSHATAADPEAESALREDIIKKETEIRELEEELRQTKTALTIDKGELDQARSDGEKLREELNAKQADVERARAEAEEQLDGLKKDLAKLEEEHRGCRNKIAELQTAVAATEAAKLELEAEVKTQQEERDPARVWTFDKTLLRHVQEAARESSTMANVNLTKKCSGEEMVTSLRRACLYFAIRANGLAETEQFLRRTAAETEEAVAQSTQALKAQINTLEAKLFHKDQLIDEFETALAAAREQLAAEKELRASASSPSLIAPPSVEEAPKTVETKAAPVPAAEPAAKTAPAAGEAPTPRVGAAKRSKTPVNVPRRKSDQTPAPTARRSLPEVVTAFVAVALASGVYMGLQLAKLTS